VHRRFRRIKEGCRTWVGWKPLKGIMLLLGVDWKSIVSVSIENNGDDCAIHSRGTTGDFRKVMEGSGRLEVMFASYLL